MEYPDYCITAMKVCCEEGSCHGKQTCRLDVDRAVSPWGCIFQTGGLGI